MAWKSKSQKSVTLSTTESEYVSLFELVKIILYVVQILQCMGIKVKLPVIVKGDNLGAIYLANNNGASQRSKHVDIRYHFFREYVAEGIVQDVSVRTPE